MAADLILSVERVTKRFGGLTAVDDVSLEVERGRVFALIGPNGAGKTTLFNCVTCFYPPTEGAVVFDGRNIAGSKPHQAARIGIARTFQNIRLFEFMSALDNVRVGHHCRMASGFLTTQGGLIGSLFRTGPQRRQERDVTEHSRELLNFVGLSRHGDADARNLAYGQQRRLEIARALATNPRLLLLDEPAAGFNPQEKVELMNLVRKIIDNGVTVFLIEHDMKFVMGVSERIVVLDHGEKIADGAPEEVRNDQRVIEAYFGKGA